jgi:hypothetical protein
MIEYFGKFVISKFKILTNEQACHHPVTIFNSNDTLFRSRFRTEKIWGGDPLYPEEPDPSTLKKS